MKRKSTIVKIIFLLTAIFCLTSCAVKSKAPEYAESGAVQTEQPISFVGEDKSSSEKPSEEIKYSESPKEAEFTPEALTEPEPQFVPESLIEPPSVAESLAEPKPATEPSQEPKPIPEPLAEPEPASETVKISIYGIDSLILSETDVSFEEGQTVFDILKKVTREQKIPLDFNGRGTSVYISGIDNIYEFDNGPESGWMYYVNGSYPNKSCSAYELNEGDVIEWKYTDKLVKDIF